MAEEDILSFDPGEQGKKLYINVSAALSGMTSNSHHDSGNVVHVDQCGNRFYDSQFVEDGSQVAGILANAYAHHELCLRGTRADHDNPLCSLHDRGTCKAKDFGAHRTAGPNARPVRSIQITNKLVNGGWVWDIKVTRDQKATSKGNVWEIHARLLTPKNYAVGFCLTKIAVDAIERIVMAWCRPGAEFRQFTHGVSNVKPACYIGIY
jgi:hypothetical protein